MTFVGLFECSPDVTVIKILFSEQNQGKCCIRILVREASTELLF